MPIVVMHSLVLIGCHLKVVDLPFHRIIDVLIILIAIVQVLELLLSVVIEAPLPLFFLPLLLLFREKALLVLLRHVGALLVLELLTLEIAELALLLQTLSGTLMGKTICCQLIHSV